MHFALPDEPVSGNSASVVLLVRLENKSSQSISILLWNTPLDSAVTGDFLTVKQLHDGKFVALDYQGPKVKRPAPEIHDYLSLKPKQVIENKLDITKSYNFCDGGTYNISFQGELSQYSQSAPSVRIETSVVTLDISNPLPDCPTD